MAAAAPNLADAIRTAMVKSVSPVYGIFLSEWQMLVGNSEPLLRFSSVLLGLLTIALAYRLGASLVSHTTGLLTTITLAISPLHVYYGRDATQSALLSFLSTASLYLTHVLLTTSTEWRNSRVGKLQLVLCPAGYVIVNTLGLSIHFSLFGLLAIAETFIFVLWALRQSQKVHRIVMWVALQIVTLILVAPWLSTMIGYFTPRPGVVSNFLWRLKDTAYGLNLPTEAAQNGLVPLLLLAALGLFPPIESLGRAHFTSLVEKIGLIAAGVVVSLVALAWNGTPDRRLPDVLLTANLSLMLLVSRGVTLGYEMGKTQPSSGRSGRRTLQLLIVLMGILGVLPMLSGLQHLYSDPAYARDDYRSIAADIRSKAGSKATIVLETPEQLDVFSYYYPEAANILLLPNENTKEILEGLIASQRRIYAVFWNTEAQDPDQLVEEILKANAIVASDDQYGGVRLTSYAVTGRPAAEPQTISGAQFGASIILDGFALNTATLVPGEGLAVTLFWRAEALLETRYKVFVHLYGPDGTLVTQHDSEPANFTNPTDSWLPDQPVIDHHGLLIPETLPGIYILMVGMYDPAVERLPITINSKPAGDRLILAEITIPGND